MHSVARAIVIGCVVVCGCRAKPRSYETKVAVRSVEVIARDAQGAPRLVEVGVEYPDCPGEQLETMQGNAEFGACFAKYKIGDVLPSTVEWGPTEFEHFDSEIIHIGDCARARDPHDARSYEIVQECTDIAVNGVKAGFHCDRKPSKDLLAKCPWFARQ